MENRKAAANAIVYTLLVVFAIITLIPFAHMLAGALKTKFDYAATLFLPAGDGFLGIGWDRITLDNFRRLFGELAIGRAMLNSLFLASMHAILTVLFCSMGGYALAKLRFKGREFVTTLVLTALIIPGPLLLAPGFKLLYQLGLLNTYTGLILPGLTPAFGVFLFRQAMLNGVPGELIEAARIDGAGEARIFFELVLPLVRPMMGAFLMISFMGTWNNFISPQIILQSPDLHPLSVALNNLKGLYGTDYALIMAGTIVSISPVMCIFLLLQREFIAGLTGGAVKG
ncbi:MAG: ABC transporter permease [Opitutaceae bacterium]|jgi:multiple sugar transport system permease protein|nr:ABC transporter permease [Opitutaceae bacterium]|tara:strand:- start:706 stop:1560 length:855 start_codon:yes stop_codon:yes gene_type:complete